MVGDITYIPTWQGWVYPATVIACATRKIVGWAMDDNYKTPLITKAIRMAARNIDLPEDAVFHSDRGSNYTSGEFAKELKKLGIRQSVGRTGICFDNALAESVNGTLKVELVHRTFYTTRQKAYEDIARWIELRYNRTRLHSGLGYRTPQEVMDEYLLGYSRPRTRCPELCKSCGCVRWLRRRECGHSRAGRPGRHDSRSLRQSRPRGGRRALRRRRAGLGRANRHADVFGCVTAAVGRDVRRLD
jgi:hypothetical protein